MTSERFQVNPFGGLAVVGAGWKLLLQRICFCYYSTKPEVASSGFGRARFAAILELETPQRRDGVRWWRIQHEDHVSYICLDQRSPGYRVTLPDGPDDFVEDLPDDHDREILSRFGEAVLAQRQGFQSFGDAEVLQLAKRLEDAVSGKASQGEEAFSSKIATYSREIQKGTIGTQAAAQNRVNALYTEGLFGLGVDCSRFSASMALFEIQAAANMWIEQRSYTHPTAFLRELIGSGTISSDAVVSVGQHHFSEGRSILRKNLGVPCLWTFQKELYLAIHHFYVAFLIGSLSAIELPYSRMVAEESLACSLAGMAYGLDSFFNESFIEAGRQLAHEISVRGQERAVEDYRHRQSSLFFPVIPSLLADLIVSYARIEANEGDSSADEELSRLQDSEVPDGPSHPTGLLFFSFVRAYLLLNAAKVLEHEELAQRAAYTVTSQLLLDRALSG